MMIDKEDNKAKDLFAEIVDEFNSHLWSSPVVTVTNVSGAVMPIGVKDTFNIEYRNTDTRGFPLPTSMNEKTYGVKVQGWDGCSFGGRLHGDLPHLPKIVATYFVRDDITTIEMSGYGSSVTLRTAGAYDRMPGEVTLWRIGQEIPLKANLDHVSEDRAWKEIGDR